MNGFDVHIHLDESYVPNTERSHSAPTVEPWKPMTAANRKAETLLRLFLSLFIIPSEPFRWYLGISRLRP